MKSDQLFFRPGFRLSVGNARSQAAVMVLPAGGKEGDSDNNHRGADQWLFVVEDTGAAIINGHKTILKAGMMVLIEAGDRHAIRNTGRSLLKTVSVHVPPAYRDEAGGTRQMRNRHFGQDVVQMQIYRPVPDLPGARADSPEPGGKPIL